VNNEYRALLSAKGLTFSGTSYEGQLVEVVEIADHPYFVASQYHPEFLSRPLKPHPLFLGLIASSIRALPSTQATSIMAGSSRLKGE
jgi:CTP synthase